MVFTRPSATVEQLGYSQRHGGLKVCRNTDHNVPELVPRCSKILVPLYSVRMRALSDKVAVSSLAFGCNEAGPLP